MSKIEWTEKTWNPVTGCIKISPGCKNCYAERMAKRLAGRFGYPKEDPFKVTLHEKRLDEPLKWKKPKMIFVCSMGDLFHRHVSYDFISRVWDTIFDCPQHTFLILTKRPDTMANFLMWLHHVKSRNIDYGNIWVGVSVENQQQADVRIPYLLECDIATKFVSCEPLLSCIDLTRWFGTSFQPWHWIDKKKAEDYPLLDWVIAGGESGPGKRPVDISCLTSLKNQCKDGKVPFFMKQIDKVQKIPEDLMIREYPK